MPTIRVSCPACRAEQDIDAAHAGREVKCGHCFKVFAAGPADDTQWEGRGFAAAASLILALVALTGSPLFCLLALKGPLLPWPLVLLTVGAVAAGRYGAKSESERPLAVAGVVISVLVLAGHLLAQFFLPQLAVGP